MRGMAIIDAHRLSIRPAAGQGALTGRSDALEQLHLWVTSLGRGTGARWRRCVLGGGAAAARRGVCRSRIHMDRTRTGPPAKPVSSHPGPHSYSQMRIPGWSDLGLAPAAADRRGTSPAGVRRRRWRAVSGLVVGPRWGPGRRWERIPGRPGRLLGDWRDRLDCGSCRGLTVACGGPLTRRCQSWRRPLPVRGDDSKVGRHRVVERQHLWVVAT